MYTMFKTALSNGISVFHVNKGLTIL